MSRVDAIVMAGAPAEPDMSPSGQPVSRAMVGLGDRTMLQWVVDALRGSPSVGRIVAVGDVSADGLDRIVEPAGDLVSNIKRGISALDPHEPVLVVSSDIPLITPEAVEDFISRATSLNADVVYPILLKSDCVARYPELQRTYLKTSDGTFTGGNMMLMSPEFISNHWGAIEQAYSARKHISKLARMIGVGILLRVLIGQVIPAAISVSALENAISRMLDANLRAVFSSYPEIGEDVDKPSDLAVVKEVLLKSGGR